MTITGYGLCCTVNDAQCICAAICAGCQCTCPGCVCSPMALPAGFAASPNLTGIKVSVFCNATPGCGPKTPCADCLSILTGAPEAPLPTPGPSGHVCGLEFPETINPDTCPACAAILTAYWEGE
jgi:hypothetical protein